MKFLKSVSDDWLAYFCFFGLPLMAIGLIGVRSYYVASVSGISPWLAVPVGLLGGGLFLGVGIASSGTDMMDFAVSSIIVIVLTLINVPTLLRARENAHRRAIKQMLQERHLPASEMERGST